MLKFSSMNVLHLKFIDCNLLVGNATRKVCFYKYFECIAIQMSLDYRCPFNSEKMEKGAGRCFSPLAK